MNKDASYINDVVEQVGLHYVQLHGTESPEFCQQIKYPVIKALPLKDTVDMELIKQYTSVTWRLLLDTPTPAWGGTGITSNWDLAQQVAQEHKILLAGGLTPENVIQAIQQVHPWGVDVSSGIETAKKKDTAKIRAFIDHVRRLEVASSII